jgi:hypothetical protein
MTKGTPRAVNEKHSRRPSLLPFASSPTFLAERRLTILHTKMHVFVRCFAVRVVFFLKPYEFGFKIPHPSLKTPHFRDHPGVGTADVAE